MEKKWKFHLKPCKPIFEASEVGIPDGAAAGERTMKYIVVFT